MYCTRLLHYRDSHQPYHHVVKHKLNNIYSLSVASFCHAQGPCSNVAHFWGLPTETQSIQMCATLADAQPSPAHYHHIVKPGTILLATGHVRLQLGTNIGQCRERFAVRVPRTAGRLVTHSYVFNKRHVHDAMVQYFTRSMSRAKVMWDA